MSLDLLDYGLRVLFIGYNPSWTSYQRGFNYAGRSNRFYKILYRSGLTDRLFTPEESKALLSEYQYGSTNLVSRPTHRADELTAEDYAAGRVELMEVLTKYRPRFACYVGKGVYTAFAQTRGQVPWGFQPTPVVEAVTDFVAPSSSGLVRIKVDEIVAIYEQLARVARQ